MASQLLMLLASNALQRYKSFVFWLVLCLNLTWSQISDLYLRLDVNVGPVLDQGLQDVEITGLASYNMMNWRENDRDTDSNIHICSYIKKIGKPKMSVKSEKEREWQRYPVPCIAFAGRISDKLDIRSTPNYLVEQWRELVTVKGTLFHVFSYGSSL